MATAIPNKANLYIIKQSKVYILILTFIIKQSVKSIDPR